MAQIQRLPIALAGKAILVLTCAAVLAACSRNADPTGAGGLGGDPYLNAPKSNPRLQEAVKEETPPTGPASIDAADPEGPVNLPPIPKAPTTPVDPAGMTVKSIAETLTINPVPGFATGAKAALIRAKVTWTPIKGAASYRVYQLAAKAGSVDASEKGKLAWKSPTWAPVAIIGGGLAGLGNLAVGQEYIYTVEAIDRAGNIMARGQDNCAPLQPLEIPYLKEPGQNAAHVGQTPYFSWTPSHGADGYYIEAFGTIRGTLPALPMWRAFRANPDSMTVQYGQQVDVMEGSAPLQWVLPLNVGSRYAWTVCAIRTDTHTLNTCKAIARATAPMNFFMP
jgi:hypothetical protein